MIVPAPSHGRTTAGAILLAAVLATCLLGMSMAGKARAATAPGDIFTVTGVPVDETAASAAAAREAARLDGERRAFRILLERLTLAEDHAKLPKVSDSRITDMVRDFSVADERSSAVRYIANLTFRFQPDPVRALLHDAGIPFAETVSKPVVVLPVYRNGDKAVLWDDPNPWRDAWANLKPLNGLVPFDVPIGEAADVAAIGAEQAVAGDPSAIATISQAHGGGDVLVAIASAAPDGGVATELRRISGTTVIPIAKKSWTKNPGESDGDFLSRVAAAGVAATEDAWKRENLLGFGKAETLTAEVPLGSLADWVAVRERLGRTPEVTRSDLRSIGRQGAEVELHFMGDPQRLARALAQRDLVLTQAGDSWTLSQHGAAAVAPPQ